MKQTSPIKTNKIINGETVSFFLFNFFAVIVLLAVKQFLKLTFSVSAPISATVGFIVALIVSYLLERRFVFRKKIASSQVKQLLFLVFKGAVDFGFYKLSDFVFFDLLDMPKYFSWTVAIVTAVLFNYLFDRNLLFDCKYEAESVRKSRIYTAFYEYRYVFIAMAISGFVFGVLYLLYSQFPTGDKTVYRMDLYHQYGPLLAELYERVTAHRGIIYSWESGGGNAFYGNFFNYLSSPLNIIIFLFDKYDIGLAISVITFVRCMLLSSSFALYLKVSKGANSILSSYISVFYSFCGYFAAFYWNIMWIDGMILLPIIALGIEKLIKNGDGRLYLASLALTLYCNYYIGYMSCIFSVMYFLLYFALTSNGESRINPELTFKNKYSLKASFNNRFINRGFKFAAASIGAAALCAFALIPVYLVLKNSSATTDTFPKNIKQYFDIFSFLTSNLTNISTTIRNSGDDILPNIYTGIFTVILVPLFVASERISIKEKACYIVALLFMVGSFIFNIPNYIWHAFHFANDLPYRYSFIYCFLILIVAYRAIENLKHFKAKEITYVAMAWVFFIILAQKMPTTKMNDYSALSAIIFLIVWTGMLLVIRSGKMKKSFAVLLAVALIFSEVVISEVGSYTMGISNSEYNEFTKPYTECIDYIHKKDKDFYKMDLTNIDRCMDSSYYGYNSMSMFSSMAYENYSRSQYSLGMKSNRINSFQYHAQTPVYNMMFNIKYLVHNGVAPDLSVKYYDKIYTAKSNKNVELYENKYYMPIAYAAGTKLQDWTCEEGDPFELQQEYFYLATGYPKVFEPVEYKDTDFDEVYGDVVTENGTFWAYKEDKDSTYGTCDITVSPVIDGDVYLYVSSSDIKSLDVSSKRLEEFRQDIDEPYILDMGYHKAGEKIKISLDVGEAESDSTDFDIYCYTLNHKIFYEGYSKLKQNAMTVKEYGDTYIKGEITVDKNSYLYSSIPYDKGWSLYIDGQKVKTFELDNYSLCAAIKPGTHTVEYKYSLNGLNYSLIISAAALLSIIGYYSYKKHSKIAKSKIEKNDLIG